MSDYITASFDELLSQSTDTASQYMRHAKQEIDALFGEGHAAANPALVAAFMQSASSDFNTASTGKIMGAVLQELAESVSAIASALRQPR